jgi:hypothetical protein
MEKVLDSVEVRSVRGLTGGRRDRMASSSKGGHGRAKRSLQRRSDDMSRRGLEGHPNTCSGEQNGEESEENRTAPRDKEPDEAGRDQLVNTPSSLDSSRRRG